MVSPFSPPVLYLTDDDDDIEMESNVSYGSSYASIVDNNLPRKKRRLPNTNIPINTSIVNWSKRQRPDHYSSQQPIYNPIPQKHSAMMYNSDAHDFTDQQSHSFHAFDWTTESPTLPRTYSNSFQTTSRVANVPPPTVMNVVKHHLDHLDTIPVNSLPHQKDRYVQHFTRKSMNYPTSSIAPPSPPPPSSSSSLSLPLPTPTSSLARPQAQRIHSRKTIRIPHSRSSQPPPPPPPPLPPQPPTPLQLVPPSSVHHPIRPIFPLSTTTNHPPSYSSISAQISTPEIRRQALNGAGILSAFYDSKCYRCNICKFITMTSSKLLQHLFTHIFFCHQCPFYSYSQHHLYQHTFENHHLSSHINDIDPTQLELLYITRCSDGTFALCMDSSSTLIPPLHSPSSTPLTPPSAPLLPPPPPPPPVSPIPPPPPPITTSTTKEKPIVSSDTNTKPKAAKRRPRQKKPKDDDIIFLPKKPDDNPQPSLSSTTTATATATTTAATTTTTAAAAVIPKRPVSKEKQPNTYVLMKHRRCYSIRNPPCLHSVTLEYNICREHTIRHMSGTQRIFTKRKFKPRSHRWNLINEVGKCLKAIVNHAVDIEENGDSSNLIYPLPNKILQLLFPNDDLHIMTNLLKLNNKYDKSIEYNELNRLESSIRTSQQHIFVLSSTGINRNDQPMFPSSHMSPSNTDTIFTETKLNTLPISCDNTHRFLKGSLNLPPQSTKPKTSKTPPIVNNSNSSPIQQQQNLQSSITILSKRTRPMDLPSVIDKNNNSATFLTAQLSDTPTVIIID